MARCVCRGGGVGGEGVGDEEDILWAKNLRKFHARGFLGTMGREVLVVHESTVDRQKRRRCG